MRLSILIFAAGSDTFHDCRVSCTGVTVCHGRLRTGDSNKCCVVVEMLFSAVSACSLFFGQKLTLPLRAQQGYRVTLSSQNVSRKYEQFVLNT